MYQPNIVCILFIFNSLFVLHTLPKITSESIYILTSWLTVNPYLILSFSNFHHLTDLENINWSEVKPILPIFSTCARIKRSYGHHICWKTTWLMYQLYLCQTIYIYNTFNIFFYCLKIFFNHMLDVIKREGTFELNWRVKRKNFQTINNKKCFFVLFFSLSNSMCLSVLL